MSKKHKQNILIYLGLFILCIAAFNPAFKADFVNWDDIDYIYENPVLLENDWSQPNKLIKEIFTQKYRSIYSPITTLTFSIEKSVYGFDNPQWWHFDNIILHSINVFLVFLILGKLGFSRFSSFLIALLFAIHPMRVEPVVWLTSRKDMVFAIFFFSGIICYLNTYKKNKRKSLNLLGVWIFFGLSLLSKVLAVTFPIVLVLIDIFKDRRINIKKLLAKVPYFLLAFIVGIASIYLANTFNPLEIGGNGYDILDRFALASSALTTYFVKFIYPYKMIPLYPYPVLVGIDYYLCIIVSLFSAFGLLWSFLKKKWILFFGLGFFLVNIVFTLQFLPVGQGYRADRYSYIAYLGLFILLIDPLSNLIINSSRKNLWFTLFIILILGIYVPLTFQQSKIWRSSETLWIHQLTYTPNNALANKNIADYYINNSQMAAAFNHLNRAVIEDPGDAGLAYSLGMLISEQAQFGNISDAIQWLNKSIKLDSSYAGVFVNRGVLLGRVGQFELALDDLNKAELLDPKNTDIYINKAVILNGLGLLTESINNLDKYLLLNKNDADKWVIKAQLHIQLNQFEDAIIAVDQGIQLNPSIGEYYFTRAIILNKMGNVKAAKNDIRKSRQYGYNGQPAVSEEILKK